MYSGFFPLPVHPITYLYLENRELSYFKFYYLL